MGGGIVRLSVVECGVGRWSCGFGSVEWGRVWSGAVVHGGLWRGAVRGGVWYGVFGVQCKMVKSALSGGKCGRLHPISLPQAEVSGESSDLLPIVMSIHLASSLGQQLQTLGAGALSPLKRVKKSEELKPLDAIVSCNGVTGGHTRMDQPRISTSTVPFCSSLLIFSHLPPPRQSFMHPLSAPPSHLSPLSAQPCLLTTAIIAISSWLQLAFDPPFTSSNRSPFSRSTASPRVPFSPLVTGLGASDIADIIERQPGVIELGVRRALLRGGGASRGQVWAI